MKRVIPILLSLSLLFGSMKSTETVWAENILPDIKTAVMEEVSSDMEKAASRNDTFPTIDGGTVSLKADASKDVTMLIFGRTTCGNSSSVLQNIAESGWIHNSKVRVIFAEIDKADEQSTKTFAKTYGCEEMTFCYDIGGDCSALMWQYLQGAGITGSVTLPAIVLLDSQNSVRSVLTGYQSSNDLFREMNQFASISGSETDDEEDAERNLVINGKEDYDEAYQVLDIVNQTRAEVGQPALKMDVELLETAMIRAAEISVFYSHTRPCGKDCFSIFRSSGSMGENIALGQTSPEDVMESWNNSPGHYANIISAAYTSIGIGCFADSDGRRYWVQCFDNAGAIDSAKSGTVETTRTIPVLQSLIHLETAESYEFGCGSDKTEVKMTVKNRNAEWAYGRVEADSSNFNYISSNPSIADVDENGIITVKAIGTSVITAAFKENPSMKVSMEVTKKDHTYSSTVIAPTLSSQGYTEHVCRYCGDTYTDTFVPDLSSGDGTPEEDPYDFSIDAFKNLDYTFGTIDGDTISSKALPSKDVTVLVFGMTTCASTWLTIKSIAESSWIHDTNVSVIYVDINGADADVIRERIEYYSQFSEDAGSYRLGCEKIIFCHDADGKNEEVQEMYQMFSGKWGTISLPMTVMVDKNDVVREILTNYKAADEIFPVIYQVIAKGNAAEIEDDKNNDTEKDNIGKDDAIKDDIGKNDTVKGETEKKPTVVKPENVRLSKTSITWTGKAQKPSIIAKDSQGKDISNADYTASYSNNKNVGQATVTVTFKNNYTGTVVKTFTILPKGTSITKVTSKKKGFTVRWKKQASQTTGYEIQYSTNSKFKGAKTLKGIKAKTTSKNVTKLKAKKKYYVRIRTYKTVKINEKSVKLYSSWSKVKKVTTKR